MSIKNPPGGFTFEFGSTLTILTTAATGVHHGKKGIFTGVVLDETELKFQRSPKHISVSVTGDYLENGDCCEQEQHQSKNKDKEWEEPEKGEDHDEWHKPHKEDQDGKKGKNNCGVKNEEDFLVLALTCPSFPFASGQIVWISIEQIIGVAVVCRN